MARPAEIEIEAVAQSPASSDVPLFHVKAADTDRWIYQVDGGRWQTVFPPRGRDTDAFGSLCAGAFPELMR